MTPAQRSLYGRMGAAIARSRHDPKELTRNARAAFLARFERTIREEYPDLPEAEIQRRAGELRRARMLELAARSSAARAKRPRRPSGE
jgi:truncated hemoglobin YjbI